MKKVSIEEYNKKIDEIIAEKLSVEDTLIKMLEYAKNIWVENSQEKDW